MPRKPKSTSPDALTPVPAEILDQFVGKGPISHEELQAAVRRFKKAIIARDERQDDPDRRRLVGDRRAARPRGDVEPQFIPKHERRFTGFDDKILALTPAG